MVNISSQSGNQDLPPRPLSNSELAGGPEGRLCVLAVATSSTVASLCLLVRPAPTAPTECFAAELPRGSRPSENILVHVKSLFDQAHCESQDLTHLAVDIGPGSFTGVRVGINLVRALSYAQQIPVYTTTSLHLLVAEFETNISAMAPSEALLPITAVVNAFGGQVYLMRSLQGREILPCQARPLDSLAQLFVEPSWVVGDGLELLSSSLRVADPTLAKERLLRRPPKNVLHPHAVSLLRLFLKDWTKVQFQSWQGVHPLYIRPSSAEENFKKG